MEFGPDGALYVLDYGTGWFGGDANSALYRIEYNTGGNRAPIASGQRQPDQRQRRRWPCSSARPARNDPDGDPITYAWDFTTNGSTDSTAANPSFTYTANGEYTATLTVRDSGGRTSTASVVIGVGRPTVQLDRTARRPVFSFGDAVPFEVQRHRSERRRPSTAAGSGQLHPGPRQPRSPDHQRDRLHRVRSRPRWTVSTTPARTSSGCSPPSTPRSARPRGPRDQHVLQPRTRQAEHFSASKGVQRRRQGQRATAATPSGTSRTATGSRSRRTT